MTKNKIIPAPHRRLKLFVSFFWVINFFLILAVGSAWLWRENGKAALPISLTSTPNYVIVSPTFEPTFTLRPADTLTPDLSDEKVFTIGFSVAGRSLDIFQFGNGVNERLIVAGIHGGSEWNTIELSNELINYIKNHPEIIPPDITLYIMPNLNPDGEVRELGAHGRLNDHGVDLNRNWPFNWQETWNQEGCWNFLPVSAGSRSASEPETISLLNFIQSHPIDALISYHSAALGIFPGGVPPFNNSIRLAEAVASVTSYAYPAIDTGCEYTGNLTDWAASQDIASIDIELTNHIDTDFDQNLKVLHILLNWKN